MGQIFTQVAVTKREASIKLDEKGFYEKKMANKRKKWILDGKDPDKEEKKYYKKIKKFKRKKKNETNTEVEAT